MRRIWAVKNGAWPSVEIANDSDPRLITAGQIEALESYGQKMWTDCMTLEKLWLSGQLDDLIQIEEEELEIARTNPWNGSAAIIASDGLFGFGAEPLE